MVKRFVIPLLLIIFMTAGAIAQTRRITGTVRDSSGNPLPNASVTVKNNKGSGASTSLQGGFSLTVQNNATVVVSAIGYATQEVSAGTGEHVDVRLMQGNNALDEVVVTALGVRREKRQLTYSTQEVKGDVLNSTKEPNVLNALTGRVSGVQITSSTGQPGSSSRIVIRGLTSFSGSNEALIVLDGVPINNDETGNAGAGSGTSRLSDIDPSTIESVNVLKGSAASALYGSKGARGVVLITTKSGSANRRPQISVTSQYSVEAPILPQVQEKYGQGDLGIFYNGETPLQKTSAVWGARLDTLKVNGQPVYNRNPMKDFFRNGITYNNTLSVSGGAGKSNYFLSYSYLDQLGTVPTTSLKRHTAFAKYTSHISDKFTANVQFSYTSSINKRVNEGYDVTSPLWTIYTMPFTYNPKPYYDSLGNQRLFRASRNNPYWVLDNIHNTSRINRFIPVVNLTYQPLSWLTITERLGADIYAEQTKYREAPSSLLITTGNITDRNANFRQFNHDLIINASKQLGSDWNVSFLVGNNALSTYRQTYTITGVGLTIPDFFNVTNGSNITARESHSLQRKIGVYAQSNIEFRRMLNLSLTGRYDGSSVLSLDKNYYPYGSASAGFIFSELLKIPAIDFGKLRVSYSAVGNDNVDPYALNTAYTPANNFPYAGRPGFLISTILGNNTLKNESTDEFETGLEMRFLKNRLSFEASYYNRKSFDLLTSVTTSSATGFSSTTLNAGDMTNKGVELLLNGTPVRSKNFSWDVTATFTRNKNKVVRIYGDQPSLPIGQTQLFVGHPFGDFYNTGYVRAPNGEIMIDAAGLPVNGSTKVIGNIQPDWLGGITNTVRYKSVSFSFFFDMRKGGDILNSDERYGYFYGTPKVTENRADFIVKGISVVDNKENTKVTTAENYYRRLNVIYESVIQDGTYIKLRNVNLTYNLPGKFFVKTPLSGISLTATGRNLWIYSPHFTGADPEVSSYGSSNGSQGVYGYSVPTSRSFNFTLNATLK